MIGSENASNPLMDKFLQQVRFLNVAGQYASLSLAEPVLRGGTIHYIMLDLVSAGAEMLALSPARYPKVRVVLFSSTEVFMLEGIPEELREALFAEESTASEFEMAPGGFRLRLGPRDMTLEVRPQETRVLLDPAPYEHIVGNSLFVKADSKISRIDLHDILYVESQKDYIVFHTRKTRIRVLSRMKNIAQRLGERDFLRIHRSFLVRIDQIRTIENEQVYVNETPQPLPVGPSYKSKLIQALRLV